MSYVYLMSASSIVRMQESVVVAWYAERMRLSIPDAAEALMSFDGALKRFAELELVFRQGSLLVSEDRTVYSSTAPYYLPKAMYFILNPKVYKLAGQLESAYDAAFQGEEAA